MFVLDSYSVLHDTPLSITGGLHVIVSLWREERMP